jgi:hypothetical protein
MTEHKFTSMLNFLRINISDNLNWSSHIQTLSLNLNKVYYIIRSVKGVVSTSVLRNIYCVSSNPGQGSVMKCANVGTKSSWIY